MRCFRASRGVLRPIQTEQTHQRPCRVHPSTLVDCELHVGNWKFERHPLTHRLVGIARFCDATRPSQLSPHYPRSATASCRSFHKSNAVPKLEQPQLPFRLRASRPPAELEIEECRSLVRSASAAEFGQVRRALPRNFVQGGNPWQPSCK